MQWNPVFRYHSQVITDGQPSPALPSNNLNKWTILENTHSRNALETIRGYCLKARTHTYIHIHLFIQTNIHIYMYTCHAICCYLHPSHLVCFLRWINEPSECINTAWEDFICKFGGKRKPPLFLVTRPSILTLNPNLFVALTIQDWIPTPSTPTPTLALTMTLYNITRHGMTYSPIPWPSMRPCHARLQGSRCMQLQDSTKTSFSCHVTSVTSRHVTTSCHRIQIGIETISTEPGAWG